MSKLHRTEPGPGPDLRAPSAAPRIIEVGEIAAGITVPEGRGVRFFSSAGFAQWCIEHPEALGDVGGARRLERGHG